MSGLLETCRELFNTDDLYQVLGVKKKASEKELKKGYHKVSLRVHPDRVKQEDKDDATRKFQTLGKVYSILSDKDKRVIYDESGEVDEEDDVAQDRDWYDYWRLLFKKISKDDIKNFEKDYKDSPEEMEDLKAAYMKYEGSMDDILDSVMCATIEDEPRFTKLIQGWIKSKEVPNYAKFTKESKASKTARKRKYDAEAKEVEVEAKKHGLNSENGESSLQAIIQKRQQSRQEQADSFLAQMEAKYAAMEDNSKSKSKGRGKKSAKK